MPAAYRTPAAAIGDLPEELAAFVLGGALLLPGGRLPLTVVEPRYVALVDAALGAGRLFGLIQPKRGATVKGAEPLEAVGTLARITAFAEAGDGRYFITCHGICRFRVRGELDGRDGYRRLAAGYEGFTTDLAVPTAGPGIDRRRLLAAVSGQLARGGAALDLSELGGLDESELVTRLAMGGPFAPEEKQALLEAPDDAERCRLMIDMLELDMLTESRGKTLH